MNTKLYVVIAAIIVVSGAGTGVILGTQPNEAVVTPMPTVTPTEVPSVADEPTLNPITGTSLHVVFNEIKTHDPSDINSPREGMIVYSFNVYRTGGTINFNVQGFDEAVAPLVQRYGLAPADYDSSTLMRTATQDKFEVCSFNLTPLTDTQIENLRVDIQSILTIFLH